MSFLPYYYGKHKGGWAAGFKQWWTWRLFDSEFIFYARIAK